MAVSATDQESALGQLYLDHHGWLQGWLSRRMGCTQNAADLAQDTFVRLLSKERDLTPLRDPPPTSRPSPTRCWSTTGAAWRSSAPTWSPWRNNPSVMRLRQKSAP